MLYANNSPFSEIDFRVPKAVIIITGKYNPKLNL